ncbi:unnamed protein product [Lampetra fluviatilis]
MISTAQLNSSDRLIPWADSGRRSAAETPETPAGRVSTLVAGPSRGSRSERFAVQGDSAPQLQIPKVELFHIGRNTPLGLLVEEPAPPRHVKRDSTRRSSAQQQQLLLLEPSERRRTSDS